jgi:hypothetical protein
VIDPPILTGGTIATSNALSVDSGVNFKETSVALLLDSAGTLKSTPVDVKFTTTNNKGKFANGTYSAQTKVTCTDNGIK